jgi:DUF917 family protein
MKQLDCDNLMTLSLGASLLGSGGGGDPGILYGHLHYLLKKNGPVTILQPADLPPEALVLPLALIGAPLISLERIPNSTQFIELLKEVRKNYPDRELVLMPAEIGGCNALTPFMLAVQTGLPVLDADLIGRAFPKLQMSKPAVMGKSRQISFLASPFGDCVRFETSCLGSLEARARETTVQFGCSAVIASFLFNAQDQDDYIIAGSLSRAMNLGRLLQTYSLDLSSFASATQAQKMGSGILCEVRQGIEDGFLTGYAEIKQADRKLRVYYQNEYLLVRQSGESAVNVAESPELITLLESRSGLPLASESLRFGLKVEVLALPAPDFWLEPRAYAQVNLQAFGLNKIVGESNV